MDIGVNSIDFKIENSDIKQGRPGYKPDLFKLKKYVPDRRLCVYSYAVHYLHRTLELRCSVTSFFITCVKPHKIPSRDTYSRWVKKVLAEAGIDTQMFGLKVLEVLLLVKQFSEMPIK